MYVYYSLYINHVFLLTVITLHRFHCVIYLYFFVYILDYNKQIKSESEIKTEIDRKERCREIEEKIHLKIYTLRTLRNTLSFKNMHIYMNYLASLIS
jgi:hypothetical protein